MDSVRFWVDAALESNRRDHSISPNDQGGPFRSARALGMTLIAMHDAFFAVAGGPAPYFTKIKPPAGATASDAAAAAAVAVLKHLYPKQAAELAATEAHYVGINKIGAAGRITGDAAAEAVIGWRAGDSAFTGGTYTPTGLPYDHDVDPLSPGQGFSGAHWGDAPPFLIPKQPFAKPPGAQSNGEFTPGNYYAQEFAEVKAKGAENSTVRTAEEEETGIFWGYDGPLNIGTPPRLYLQVALTVLDGIAARPGTWLHQGRMLQALTACAVALADASIQAWHYKYSTAHMMWRPVLGVRLANDPSTPADPAWRPLGRPDTNRTGLALTPDFPAYPSGHATFGGASFEVLRRFIRKHDSSYAFGDGDEDNIAFTFVSDEYNGMNKDPRTGQPRPRRARRYPSLWRAIVDNSESRIFLGVHWRFDGISMKGPGGKTMFGSPPTPADLGEYGGVRLGMDIAKKLAEARDFD